MSLSNFFDSDKECLNPILEPNFYTVLYVELSCSLAGSKKKHMGGQQKNFISDIVFFQHQDGMRKKVRRHFLQCKLYFSMDRVTRVHST